MKLALYSLFLCQSWSELAIYIFIIRFNNYVQMASDVPYPHIVTHTTYENYYWPLFLRTGILQNDPVYNYVYASDFQKFSVYYYVYLPVHRYVNVIAYGFRLRIPESGLALSLDARAYMSDYRSITDVLPNAYTRLRLALRAKNYKTGRKFII